MIRVAINGFGRIGQMIFRLMLTRDEFPDMELVAINDLAAVRDLARRMQRDSVYGGLGLDAQAILGTGIRMCAEKDPAALPWKELNVDLVFDATGRFTTQADLGKHIDAGAKKVMLTAPTKDPNIPMVVRCVNDELVKGATIVSNASCTTNCVAPVCYILHKAYGIKWGHLVTVHAVTNSQMLFDGFGGKDPRGARGCMDSIIPASTGAAKAVGVVIPDLKGRIDGFAARVPVKTGSYAFLDLDLRAQVKDAADVNAMIRRGIDLYQMFDMVDYTEDDQFVSHDVSGMTFGSVVSGDLTKVAKDGENVKIHCWYDNEMGYTYQMLQVAMKMFE